MAGLFRKRQFKPWIVSCVTAQEKKIKSKVVKVLCRRSNDPHGCMVLLVSDGELSISAAFPTEAVDTALSNIGLDRDTRWDNALLILQEFSLDLKMKGEDVGEYVVYVEKFKIWDLQPGYTAKFDVKYCMEDSKVLEKMTEEVRVLKERAVSEADQTGNTGLSQLLDEMAKPSETSTQSSHVEVEDRATKCTENLSFTRSIMEELLRPLTVNEFLIPESQAEILHNITEWQSDYQPEGDTPSNSDQQFDVCAANTLSSPPDNTSKKCHLSERKGRQQLSQSVLYLGISISPKERTDKAVVKKERHSPGSVALSKVGNSSLSQGTCSQWQNELESVEFSFQDSSVTSSQVPMEESNPDLTLRNHSRVSIVQSPEEQEGSNKLDTREICDKTNKDVPTKNILQVTEKVTKQTDNDNREKHEHVIQAKPVLKSPIRVRREKLVTEPNVSVNESKNSKTMTEKDPDFVKTAETENNANLKPGTKVLKQGTKELKQGTRELKQGTGELKQGTRELKEGTRELKQGTKELKQGTRELKQGTKELKQGTKELKQGTKVINSYTNVNLGNRKKASDLMGKTHITLNETKQIQRAVNTNNEDRNESFELGSPNAHSTQMNEVEKNMRKDNQKISSSDIEFICDSTDENVSLRLNEIDTQSSQNEAGTQSSQSEVDIDQSVDKNYSVLSLSGDESEIRDKVGTCSGPSSVASSSDVDKTVMLNYYSQSSTSKSNEEDWCRERLDDERERLQALRYKAHRWLTLIGSKGIKTEPFDIDEINMSPKRSVELFSNNIQGEDVTKLDEESQTGVSTVDSIDTSYPLVSLSLRDSVEKNSNSPLTSLDSSECTNLEEVDRIHREKIAEYYETGERDVVEYSELSDIELSGDRLEQDMRNVKVMNGRRYLNDSAVNDQNVTENSGKCIEENNNVQPIKQFTPLYFETEPGSRKRSRKLIKKVISCREKDLQINSDSKGKSVSSNESFVKKVNKYRKEMRYSSIKKKGVSRNQTNNPQISTQIDGNILRGVNKNINSVQWKFKKCIRIILKRCDEKENSFGVDNNQNSAGACGQGVESDNVVDKSDKISKQNDTVNCSENEVTYISKTVGSKTFDSSGDGSEGTVRVPVSENDVESYVGRKITEEKGKRINGSDSDLTSAKRLIDNSVEKLSSGPGKEDNLLIGAETVQKIDYSEKDNNSARVLRDNDFSLTEVNVCNNSEGDLIGAEIVQETDYSEKDKSNERIRTDTDFSPTEVKNVSNNSVNDSNRDAAKCQLTPPAEKSMETCLADLSGSENNHEQCQSVQNIITSTLQNTQPFEICQYPESQEFVPESPTKFENESPNFDASFDSTMSSIIPKTQEFVPHLTEHLDMTPLSDALTTGNDKSIPGTNLSDNSDKISKVPLSSKRTSNSCENLKELGKKSSDYPCVTASPGDVVKTSGEKLLDKEVDTENLNKHRVRIEHEEPSTSSAVVKSADYKSSDKIKELHSDTINADQRVFTKLINKSERPKTSSDIPTVISPGKTMFKVKPYGILNLQRKRKSSNDNNDGDIQVSSKKHKMIKDNLTKPFKNKDRNTYIVRGDEQGHTASVSKMLVDISDNSFEEYVVIGIPTKTFKTLTETVGDDNEDIVKDVETIHDVEKKGKTCKTNEPHKIYIDGNCFGKILKQNNKESSYPASASCETKNKPCIEKTNMRKSSLDSSQGSGKRDSSQGSGKRDSSQGSGKRDSSQGSGKRDSRECCGQAERTSVINISSESRHSEENNKEVDKDNSSPESVSLLTSKKQLEESNVGSKVSLEKQTNQTKLKEPVKVLNNTESKGTNSDLVCTRVNGLLRFYRQNPPENTLNIHKKVSENVKTRDKLKNTKRNSINYDKHLFNHTAKGKSGDKQIKVKENTNEGDEWTRKQTKKSYLNDIEVLDKNMLVQDWLMGNNKIGGKNTSTTDLSSPDNETLGDSLPSCQPVCACGQQPVKGDQVNETGFLINDGLDEEQHGKDNSSCDSSSAVSSSSVNSEDLKKPMSAAARYLLKFKKARRERKKRELLKRKLEKRPTV